MASTLLRCAGCGALVPPLRDAPFPFRCAHAVPGDDIDHVVERVLDPAGLTFPLGGEPSPFARFRAFFHAYQTAIAGGMSNADYLAIVDRLDARLEATSGRRFRVTPLTHGVALGERLGFTPGVGGVWIKNETVNPGDSHKSRHLVGIMLYLEVVTALDLGPESPPPLAIASCGNAALAAAVVARAAGRELSVFVPPDADPEVLTRLAELGAHVTKCPRIPGVPGDPAVRAFREEVARGAIPFACQGSDAGLTIDGGATIGAELAATDVPFDRVLVQVGGGAFASAVIRGFLDALALGRISKLPRFHAVQTRAVAPLRRAYDGVADRILTRLGLEATSHAGDAARAAWISAADPAIIGEELAFAARHRSLFMWPWEQEPHSLAGAIIDDETYDWLAVVRGMLLSGGYPLTVDEPTLARAHAAARETTSIQVGPSGSAGLAGLMHLLDLEPKVTTEKVAVIFSGVRG